jgi:hypothetical protein
VTFDDGFDDSNGDGFADLIDMYPDFNDRILGSAQPVQRDAGVTEVGGVKVLFQYITFAPGATIAGRTTDPALGAPVVTVLNNAGDPQAAPEPLTVTDACTPAEWSTVSFATAPDGTVLVRNPAQSGTYTFNILWLGERDADEDGIENTLDPCPLDGDPTWNPRAATATGPGDADGDGLPSSCDPDDGSPVNDQDGDAHLNRADNCPTLANGVDQTSTPAGNQTDIDSDGIGDACDPNPDDADSEGTEPQALLRRDVTVSEPAAAAPVAPPAAGSGSLTKPRGSVEPWSYVLAAGGAALLGTAVLHRRLRR